MSRARLSINHDCKTTPQWLSRGGFAIWRNYAGLTDKFVELEWERADAIMEMAKGIPGWNSGQTEAPHPLQIEDVD